MERSTTTREIQGPDAPDAGEAVIGFGIATAVRDAAIGGGVVLGLLYLFPVLGLVVGRPGWRRQIATITAGLRLHASAGLSIVPVSPWVGLGVLAAAAATVLMTVGLLLRFRNV